MGSISRENHAGNEISAAAAPGDGGGAKHTPGPWRVCGGTTPHYKAIASEHGYIVFQMADRLTDTEHGECIQAPPYEEQDANARLIAASPDLYDACQLLLDALKVQTGVSARRMSMAEVLAPIKPAEAAIARATASQPPPARAAAEGTGTDLHSRIMNLPADTERVRVASAAEYLEGHRDARHAAAELALEATAHIDALAAGLARATAANTVLRGRVAELVDAGRDAADKLNVLLCLAGDEDPYWRKLMEAIEKAEQNPGAPHTSGSALKSGPSG